MDLTEYDRIVINSSAGKDSLAMLAHVHDLAQAQGVAERLVVIHADLGRAEWPGTGELAQAQAELFGVPFLKVSRPKGDLPAQIRQRWIDVRARGQRLYDRQLTDADRKYVQRAANKAGGSVTDELLTRLAEQDRTNPIWPGSQTRYCTSDQKRDTIAPHITRMANELRATLGRAPRILNCLGLRAEESPPRAKAKPLEVNRKLTGKGTRKQVWTWLPIHAWTEVEVWDCIRNRELPYHPAYDLGMPRLSCVFCVFAGRDALLVAGKANPELLDLYCDMESEIGYSFRQDQSLAEVRQALVQGEQPGTVAGWNM